MKTVRALILSFLAAALIWAAFTWPLPLHVTRGIPSSSQNVEKDGLRTMIPGDHLQLLYHYWLFADMLRGRTPWFYNVYEFNLGDDSARLHATGGFFPFFLVHALGEALVSRAFGYNLAAFFSIWMSVLFTALLVRRYSPVRGIVAVSVLAGILLPYRWTTLLGGSPSGAAMMWIPAFFLGLDIAARDLRSAGGLLALVGVGVMTLGDMHALLFSALAAPFWCVFALAANPGFDPRVRRHWLDVARALWPLLGAAPLVIAYELVWSSRTAGSILPDARSYGEVALYSPSRAGFFAGGLSGVSSTIYVGLPLLLLLLAGLLAAIVAAARSPRSGLRPLCMLALAWLGLLGVAAFALGTNGPGGGLLLVALRKLVPPLRLLRQPAKIFCLMPVLVAVATALSLGTVCGFVRQRILQGILLAVAGLALALDFKAQIRPTICRLDARQGAYAAVAADTSSTPRALILPLWLGDAVHSSLYQYYASLYRIRMVNGYNPLLKRAYIEAIRPLLALNTGELTDELADGLLDRGIGDLILHEDAFPEKVSPFGVCVTLDKLRNHRRLELLGRDGPAWAFKILPSGKARPAGEIESPYFFPARRREAERFAGDAVARSDHTAGGGLFVTIEAGDPPLALPPMVMPDAPRLRWLIRARGHGTMIAVAASSNEAVSADSVALDSDAWAWRAVPLPEARGAEPLSLLLRAERGAVDLDLVILAAGSWEPLLPGQSLHIPADRFFHAGFSDPETGSVTLRQTHEPTGIVFYGPKLPLEEGIYEFALDYTTPAEAGTELGRINIRQKESDPVNWHSVRAGCPASVSFLQEQNLPTRLELLFTREGDMTIREVVISRSQ